MQLLSPIEAAVIARGVYRLRDESAASLRERGQSLGCEELFSLDDCAPFDGHSGGLSRRSLGRLGYIAAGVGTHAGDVLIALRGTAMKLDWLSNLNVGMELGPGGFPVHAGFHEVWKSFAHALTRFLAHRNPTRIHCVGHSLGGALAALTADHLSAHGVADVVLYTFGTPRCGDGLFARALSRRLGTERILRVWHPADPVPMIPLFPFCHMAFGDRGLALPAGGLVNVGAHRIEESYMPLLHGQTWRSLAAGADGGANEAALVQSWLARTAARPSGLLMGSATLLVMIGRALRWLLECARDLIAGAIGLTLAIGATVFDQLAWLLARGASLSRDLGDHLSTLIRAIFGFLGRSQPPASDMGAAFVRWVLGLLYASLHGVAERALVRPG